MRQGTGKWYRIANRSPQNMRLDMQMLYEGYHLIETLMLCCLLKLTFLNFLVELAFWKLRHRRHTELLFAIERAELAAMPSTASCDLQEL